MKLIKPKFWDTKNFISFILYPLSAITYLINITKKLSNKKKFEIINKLNKIKIIFDNFFSFSLDTLSVEIILFLIGCVNKEPRI